MRQRTDRDEVDAALGIGAHRLEGDAAARFGLAASGDLLDRQARHFGREIVEHDAVDASGGEHLVDVLQRAHLAFDGDLLAPRREIGLGARDGPADAAGEVDVVVLQQDHVEQSHAVVLAAADLHGHLVQHAHAGRGLARVEHARTEPFEVLHVEGRLRGHAAHALHDVEQDAFGLEQRAQAPRDVERHVARPHAVAVGEDAFEPHLRIEAVQHDLGDLDAGDDALLFAEQAHAAVFVLGDAAERGVVAVADVLLDAEFDQFVYERSVFGFHDTYVVI